ncbi:hypothetical protein BGW38_005762 [Lunasporangiospora selenospora]|uniref:Ketoreductase domain-containing protein n=1 Tax=Lunasporangiospora selenospora TaxID=979761 RepID=A0A9P6G066_9FUNG|nr:hypothetical protein BGW38_005762 [Lunasporangiospora selenospora]
MTNNLRFDGRVVIVTGAGGGLGRSHALAFGSRGASVVVNDLGGSHTGEGASKRAADMVVDEIQAAGGKAVANYDSVLDGEKIVETAMKAFGRVDIVVNNAGILKDVSFARMTDQQWDLIFQVHVDGAYKVLKAAWPIFRKQKYGRVINTTSAAGIYGNFGQANYSAAKLALVGLTSTLALEGKKENIHSNVIAPMAASRMTETIMPPDMLKSLKPEMVTPLVLYLCHEDTKENGSLFEVGAGFVGKLRWERTGGYGFPNNKALLPEHIQERWAQITNFEDGRVTHPGSTQESMESIIANFENLAGDSDAKAPSSGPSPAKKTSGGSGSFKSAAVFDRIKTSLEAMTPKDREAQIKKVKAAFEFKITNKEGKEEVYYVDLKNGNGDVGKGANPKGKCEVTVSVTDDDFVDLADGKANAQKMFMSGKIKVKGQVMLATKLGDILKAQGDKAKL